VEKEFLRREALQVRILDKAPAAAQRLTAWQLAEFAQCRPGEATSLRRNWVNDWGEHPKAVRNAQTFLHTTKE
jgi:hypothetical protein